MSVPKWKRKESPTEFLKELYDLNVRCGQIVMKYPTKYRQNYGDFLIKQCLRALECAEEGNGIYLSKHTKPEDVKERRRLFSESLRICDTIPTISYIFFELAKNNDGYKGDAVENEIFFAQKCDTIGALLAGVIKSDEKRYKEYISK